MTRDGLAEQNLATGEETLIGRQDREFDPRKAQPAHGSAVPVRQAASEGRTRRPPNAQESDAMDRTSGDFTDTTHQPGDPPARTALGDSSTARRSPDKPDAKRKAQSRAGRRHYAAEEAPNRGQPEAVQTPAASTPEDFPASTERTEAREGPDAPAQSDTEAPARSRMQERPGRLRFDDTRDEPFGPKPRQRGTKYQRQFMEDGAASKTDASPDTGKTAEAAQPPKSERLRFSEAETPPEGSASGKKLEKAQYKAEHSAAKLEAAKRKLPKKHSVKVERTFDAETGKPRRRLRFEEEVKTRTEHLKGPLPLRPVKVGANAAIDYAHKKIGQVEQENAGVEAAHKGERLAEGALRRTYRFHRLKPYRRAAKLEQKTAKRAADLAWKKTLHDNPKLQSSVFSRMAQKRKIKRQYAQAAREAGRAAEKAQKAGGIAVRAVKAAAGFVRRHPGMAVGVAGIALILCFVLTMFSSCGSMAGGGFLSALLSSYTAEDADILAVDAAYTQMEVALQAAIDQIERQYPGYDEYHYFLAETGHDPFELASYLTVKYFDYTPEEVRAELQAILEQQYTLTVTEKTETRYRAETRANSDGSTYTVQVPYAYRILNVTLENHGVGSVAAANLDADQMELYSLYMETKGNKPYLFEDSIYVNTGTSAGDYADYEIPPEALSDGTFAALIAEAEKYLGYPYVWGGSKPSTSFDCSGFICWVLNQSGVASVGRTSAQGIYNQCTPVSSGEAKPGDLIFFTRTYETSRAVTHVGIYVGNGMMIHCGNPIQYTSINTSYWQNHFYGFGRIN